MSHFKKSRHWVLLFFRLIKGLGQLVAVWQCCLRLSNMQSCCATLEYRLRNICSNKFGIYSQPLFQTFGYSAHSPCLHCSNLRQPFESFHLFDSPARCGTVQATYLGRLFRLIKGLARPMVPWTTCLGATSGWKIKYLANWEIICKKNAFGFAN